MYSSINGRRRNRTATEIKEEDGNYKLTLSKIIANNLLLHFRALISNLIRIYFLAGSGAVQ